LKVILLTFIILFFTACGYKPTSHYAKNEIKGKVFVAVKIDIANTTNSVFLKDTINKIIIRQFDATLTNHKKLAATILTITLDKVSLKTLQDDNQGYVKLYRTNVFIKMIYTTKDTTTNKKITKTLNLKGSDDYSVDSDSIISSLKREESVKNAIEKALANILANVAIKSFKIEKLETVIPKKVNKTNAKQETKSKSKSFFFFN